MADSNSYPMISEKNWWTIREKFNVSAGSAQPIWVGKKHPI